MKIIYNIKTVRRIVQWSLFLIFITGFLPFGDARLNLLSGIIIHMQFFPALKRIAAFALLILLITFVFGRIYCSSICPFATIQDLLISPKKKFSHRKLNAVVRYSIPALSLILLTAGFPVLSSAFDPYSISGRILNTINRFIILPFINLAVNILKQFSIYMPSLPFTLTIIPLIFTVLILILLFTLTRKGGRLYCNTLCPVGALLSIPSRFSLFAPRIIKSKCTGCGACEKVCKAEAINTASRTIDNSKCISCFNCLSVCRFNALEYRKKTKSGAKLNKERRGFLKKSAAGSLLLVSIPLLRSPSWRVYKNGSSAATPPGSENRTSLLSKCTACSLCISRCPTRVLQPSSFTQLGIAGFGAPYMNYNKGQCDFNCKICSEVCPSGAISKLNIEKKKIIKIGESKFVRKFCIVETEKTSCGACAEICPTGAIDLIHIGESENGPLEIPVINTKYCIGCGSCQFVCPVIEKNAIFVIGYEEHKTAEVIDKKKQSIHEEPENGFAF